MAIPTTLQAGRIMAMPAGRELDVLVAERVFGQTVGRAQDVPNYSTRLADVQVVIDYLHHRWGSFELCGERQWCCSAWIKDGPQVVGYGHTPELAICRAALLTVME